MEADSMCNNLNHLKFDQLNYPTSLLVKVGNKNLRALLDTGSCVSLIDKSIYDQLKFKEPIQRCDFPLTAANGSKIKIFGHTKLKIKIGKEIIEYVFLVAANLSRSMILGRDFIFRQKITFYSELKQIKINKSYVPLSNDQEVNSITRLGSTLILQPNCSYVVHMVSKKAKTDEPTDVMFTPTTRGYLDSQPEIFVSPAILKLNKKMPVQITNTSNKTVRLKRGCVLGEIETDTSDVASIKAKIPPHNAKLSNDEFLAQAKLPTEYKKELENFLLKLDIILPSMMRT